MSAMEEAIQEFTSECDEMLERISLGLSKLEKEGFDQETMGSIYRDMHTIKGSSQLFGFHQIGTVAHAMESSLDPIRQNIIKPSSNLIDIIYQGCDLVGRLVKSINESHKEHEAEDDLLEIVPRLIDCTLTSLNNNVRYIKDDFLPLVVKNESNASISSQVTSQQDKVIQEESLDKKPAEAIQEKDPAPERNINKMASEKKETSDIKIDPKPNLDDTKVVKESSPSANTGKDVGISQSTRTNMKQQENQKSIKIDTSRLQTNQQNQEKVASEKRTENQETIRVQVSLLDKLMNLAGELVLVRNQVLRFASNEKNAEFSKIAQKVNLVTSEIQNEVMKTRMQPVGSILSKFHRVVRDLAKELGKKIELKLEGTETELDKTLIEAVKDPLTHIIRNSADHGLETPEERRNKGKPETGRIAINSYHEGGQVVIEINDNGRGLDKVKIGEKAIEKGIITYDQYNSMSDKEIYHLIFAPGFSTAAAVSNISGRGVGMDVVKTNIERIGGIIDLNAIPGEGTKIYLKIPLTLAIVPALLIRSGNERFAIPQVKLLELLRINSDGENQSNKIELLQGKPIYRLRGQLLPLVSLNQLIHPEKENLSQINNDKDSNIVVLKAGSVVFGLIVDEIEDSADIVVKPLTQFLKSLGLYAGATLLGDGNVALTLDVMGIADKAMLGQGEEETDLLRKSRDEKGNAESMTDYLVVDVGDRSRYTFPLSLVNRLEVFKSSDYDFSGDQQVIRYRGGLLPIISVRDFFGLPEKKIEVDDEKQEDHPVVVVQHYDRLFGLEVDNILDVIGSSAPIDEQIRSHQGILGSFIDRDKVFVVIDAVQLIQKYSFEHGIGSESSGKSKDSQDVHIMVVEDSKFFRNHIQKCLEDKGYRVSTAENGEKALDTIIDNKESISVVVSDIEMPKMDGYTLAETLSRDQNLNHIPMVAVTTRFRDSDIARGKQAGFREYLEKLNESQLITTIENILRGE